MTQMVILLLVAQSIPAAYDGGFKKLPEMNTVIGHAVANEVLGITGQLKKMPKNNGRKKRR